LSNINHKKIKNLEHYNNCIKYIDLYEDVPVEDEEDTVIEYPPNQLQLAENNPIPPPDSDVSSLTLVSEERSRAPESYINDYVTPKRPIPNDSYKPTAKRMAPNSDNISSVGTSVSQRKVNKRTASEISSDEVLPSLCGSKRQRVLITGEMLTTIQNKARELLNDRELHELEESEKQDLLHLQGEYAKMVDMFNQQEKGMQVFIQELNKSRPMSEYERHVMSYDFFTKKSTYRAFHLIDILLGRQNHQIKKDKIPIFILVGEASCGKSKIAQYVANVIG
jgi:hypothetical protein